MASSDLPKVLGLAAGAPAHFRSVGRLVLLAGVVGAVGLVFQAWMPSVVTRIDVFVILGMAAFFSAAAKRQRGLLPLTLPRRPCILPRAGVFRHT